MSIFAFYTIFFDQKRNYFIELAADHGHFLSIQQLKFTKQPEFSSPIPKMACFGNGITDFGRVFASGKVDYQFKSSSYNWQNFMGMNDRNKHHGATNKPAQMKLVRFAFPYLAIVTLLFNVNLLAQTSENRLMAGLSATFLDYQGPMTNNYIQYKTFDPGISFGAHAYINKLMNVSLNSAFIPEATYPTAIDQYIGTSLIDVNGLVQLKTNGLLLKEDAPLAPYIVTGFGLNTASNNVRLYVPAGLGVRFQLTDHFNFQLQSMYKFRLGQDKFQHVSHSAGFVFALPQKRKPNPKPPVQKFDKDKPIASAELPDSDKDGVPDRDDLCPNLKGKAMYLGCPAEATNKTESTFVDDNTTKPQTLELDSDNSGLTDLNQTGSAPPLTSISNVDISEEDRNRLEEAMNNIYFEKASDKLTPESHDVLDDVAMSS